MKEKKKKKRKKKQQKKNNNEKKNNLYQQKNKNVEEEITESRSTNVYKRFFAAETYPTCLEFSSCDNSLMVGTSFQKILPLNIHNLSGPFLDKNTMLQIKEIADKDDKNAEITDIQFSPDKKHFAATDNLGRIGLFKLENNIWSLVARFHFIANTHIISFCFNEIGDRIFAITEDRLLNEFKLTDDVYENYTIQKPNVLKIEDDCNLTSVVSYPLSIGKEKNLVISNDAYKIRQVNTYDDKLQITKTSLGPCFGGPITLMRVVPGKDKDKRLIAFSTKEKIMGLMSLPIDGNPYRYMGVIAHPGDIKNINPISNKEGEKPKDEGEKKKKEIEDDLEKSKPKARRSSLKENGLHTKLDPENLLKYPKAQRRSVSFGQVNTFLFKKMKANFEEKTDDTDSKKVNKEEHKKFVEFRKKSIKNEFLLVKEMMKKDQNTIKELEDSDEEVKKNTDQNVKIGKEELNEEDSSERSNNNSNDSQNED